MVAVFWFTRNFLQGSDVPRTSLMTDDGPSLDEVWFEQVYRDFASDTWLHHLLMVKCAISYHGPWSCPCAPHYAKERGEDYYGIGKHLKWVAYL